MWEKIKNLLSNHGNKCIIVEQGKPSYLVMKLDDDQSEIEKVNQDIEQIRNHQQESETSDIETNNQKVKVEDLPF